MFNNKQMKKQTVVHPNKGILLGNKKEQTIGNRMKSLNHTKDSTCYIIPFT